MRPQVNYLARVNHQKTHGELAREILALTALDPSQIVIGASIGEPLTKRLEVDCSSAPDAAGQTSGSNRGYRTTGGITYQWQRSAADADAAYGALGGATTDPYNDTTAPANGDGRWYYAELSATGTTTQDTTHDRGFRAVIATIATLPVSGFSEYTAIPNGSLTTAGVPTVTITGFDYGLTDAYGSSVTTTGTWEDGDLFWDELTALTPGTVYHFRAKANNGFWGYGEDMVFSTEGSPVLYEFLNENDDADGDDIYGANWADQQFTVGATAHTVTTVRLPLKRILSPGTVTLSITHADGANKPTGSDLETVTLDGDAFSTVTTWYTFEFSGDLVLRETESYALVLRAVGGDAANYVEWRWDSGGSLANAVAGQSTDSGVSWTVDGGGADYLFEIWGNPVMAVLSANVFSSYQETDDWLIVLSYNNIYEPYYPTGDPAAYFYLQLVDDTTIKHQGSLPNWGYRPGSIYLSATLAATLAWGTDYKIRMQGTFTGTPFTDYVLTGADWRGDELTLLDQWVLALAADIALEDGVAMTQYTTGSDNVLNSRGGTLFQQGIPGLSSMRPDIFYTASRFPLPEDDEHTPLSTTMTDAIGGEVTGVLSDWGDLFDEDEETFTGTLALLGLAAVLVLGAVRGHILIGLGVAYVGLIVVTVTGVVGNYVALGLVTFIAIAIFVFQKFSNR